MTSLYENFRSAQQSPHPYLFDIVMRHKNSQYLRPIPRHQKTVFMEIMDFINKRPGPLILDSCCGTGMSTKKLATLYPDHAIIGIDKSSARLKRAEGPNYANCLLVRGDIFDLWRLISEEQLSIARHYVFFPNPWPKKCHIKRRIYGHPMFQTMLLISPFLEIRTNWKIYAEEFLQALTLLGQRPTMTIKQDKEYMTLFEKKYIASTCPIYVITNKLHSHDANGK